MQVSSLPITGRDLIRLLERNGWTIERRSNHGAFLSRRFPGEARPRTTVIPDKNRDLGEAVLGRILGPKQTGLGKAALERLMNK
jgi:predicted RNA binding protein YcfA (HicA-like mRNA interferase family)